MQPSSSVLAAAILIALPGLANAGSPAAPAAAPGPYALQAPVAHAGPRPRPAYAGQRQPGFGRGMSQDMRYGRPAGASGQAPAAVLPGARVMARDAGWRDGGGAPAARFGRGAVVRDVAPPASAYAWGAQPRSSIRSVGGQGYRHTDSWEGSRAYGRPSRRWSAAGVIVAVGAGAAAAPSSYEPPRRFQSVEAPTTRVVSDEVEAAPAPRYRRARASNAYASDVGYRPQIRAPRYGYSAYGVYAPAAYAPVASSTVGYAATAYPNGAGVAYSAPVARQIYYNRPVLGVAATSGAPNCDPMMQAW